MAQIYFWSSAWTAGVESRIYRSGWMDVGVCTNMQCTRNTNPFGQVVTWLLADTNIVAVTALC